MTGVSPRAPDDGSASDRVLDLEGGQNFRDLGGYETKDGRRVKWRVLFRSGSMARLTPSDYERLAPLGIKAICDFRTTSERVTEPNVWSETANIDYWARDYEMSFAELRRVLASDLPSADAARVGMMAGYRSLPFELAPSYRELFSRLATGQVPLAFNCSAGKDRAGTAAALVLTALGVPRETVIADYLLTEKMLNIDALLQRWRQDNTSSLAQQPSETAKAILGVDARYIEAALDAVDEQHGGIHGYVQDALGLDQQGLQAIHDHLLD